MHVVDSIVYIADVIQQYRNWPGVTCLALPCIAYSLLTSWSLLVRDCLYWVAVHTSSSLYELCSIC